jgi:laminin, beta 1
VVVREPYPDRPPSWTGPGFVKVFEGGDLSFTVDNIPKTMPYDIQLRYSPQIRGSWDDVRISVVRPDGIPVDSACYNVNLLEEQERPLRLHEYETKVIALNDLCLEEGKTYKFIVSFHRQSSYEPNPNAQILVDSVKPISQYHIFQRHSIFFSVFSSR